MTLELSKQFEGKLIVTQITGTLHKEDYEQFIPVMEEAIKTHGKIRLLVQMYDFHGWDAGALWQDVKFDARHFNDIERIAFVGDKKWERGMSMFCKPFTTAKIQYFDTERNQEAQEWVKAELGAPTA